MEKIGTWAFLLGVLIAVVAGLTKLPPIAYWVLVVLGLIVGFLNIRAKEVQEFLIASTAIVVMIGMGAISLPDVARDLLGPILTNIIAFVAPAAFLVALRAVWQLAED